MNTTTRLPTRPATPDWKRALCAQTDSYLFFPEGVGGQIAKAVDQAKAVCAQCPIQPACLQWALDNRQNFGVWGGLDDGERRARARAKASVMTVCLNHRQWIEEQLAAGRFQESIAADLGVSQSSLARAILQFRQEGQSETTAEVTTA